MAVQCAKMGKNDHNLQIGYALLKVGRRERERPPFITIMA